MNQQIYSYKKTSWQFTIRCFGFMTYRSLKVWQYRIMYSAVQQQEFVCAHFSIVEMYGHVKCGRKTMRGYMDLVWCECQELDHKPLARILYSTAFSGYARHSGTAMSLNSTNCKVSWTCIDQRCEMMDCQVAIYLLPWHGCCSLKYRKIHIAAYAFRILVLNFHSCLNSSQQRNTAHTA